MPAQAAWYIRAVGQRFSFLDDLAVLHNGYTVAQSCRHAKVMGHHDHGDTGPPQLLQFIQNEVFAGRVNSGGNFVCDDQFRALQDRQGNHYTLQRAAGQLMGIAVDDFFRIGQIDIRKRGSQPPPELCPFPASFQQKAQFHLFSQLEHGRKGGHGVLRNHTDLLAPIAVQLIQLHRKHFFPVPLHTSAQVKKPWIQQPHNALAGHALSAAALPDQAKGLSAFYGEADGAHKGFLCLLCTDG